MKLNIYIPRTDETVLATTSDCQFGEMPIVTTEDNRSILPGDYIPVTNSGRRCDFFKSDKTEDLRKIMDDKDEHPIVRHLAKEEYMRRLVRDYVPDTCAGETSEVKMAKILENTINNLSFSQRKMADHFCQYAHKSLDKDLFNGFISRYIIVHAWKWRNSKPGTGPMYYDGRNEYVCEQCSKIVDALEWGYYYDEYCRELAKKMNR